MAELSTQCSVDQFIKDRLKSSHVTSKGMITGYLDSRQAYDELIRDLKVLGCCYSVRSCYSGKTDAGSLQYKVLSSDLQIPFTGCPFHVEGTTYFVCTHGIRYFKSKMLTANVNEDDPKTKAPKKKLRKTNESIKMGCPAKMTVKCIRVYPDYKTSSDSWRRKADVLKKLKEAMKHKDPPRFELNFWISVSPESAHTHERTQTQRIQTLHPELIAEIHNLVKRDVTSIPIVKAHLKTYVDNMFKTSSVRPDSLNTAFYPCDKSIYNHVYEAKLSASRERGKISPHDSISATPSSLPSTEALAPRQDHQMSEKCDSDLAAVPVLESSFASDWQDQTVLPTNFVQVLSNNGTLMLMVTQPLNEQVVGQVENSSIDSSTSLVNVNLDDNIYTVIADPSDQQILSLNGESNIVITQPCSDHGNIEGVLNLQDDEAPLLSSEKNDDINLGHVISMESNVIMNVQRTSSINHVRDVDDLSCTEDPNQYLFVEDDSEAELFKTDKIERKEFSSLCSMSPTDPPKDHETRLFPATLNVDPSKNINEVCGMIVEAGVLKKSRRKRRRLSDNELPSYHEVDSLSSPHKALRCCAEDIVEMSYSLTNSALLDEMLKVFEKYRERLRDELELCKVTSNVNVPLLALSDKSNMKISCKLSGFCGNEQESSENSNCLENSRSRRNRGTIFTSSDSSIDDYDDLVITG